MRDVHPTAAEGFGRDTAIYGRGRPGYPPETLAWLTRELGIGPGKTVLEIGAGTGKFSSLLARTGADVIAVEPVAAMIERLHQNVPGIRALQGSAECLPFATASVDVVTCAQSFHWFANTAALAEIHRVLKPGGGLGLVWNVRDRSVAWVDELSRLVDRFDGDAPRYDDGEWRNAFTMSAFEPLRETSVMNIHTGSAEDVIVNRTASVSFVAAMPEAERNALLDEVRALITRTPELAGKPVVGKPYVTRMYWCRSRPG